MFKLLSIIQVRTATVGPGYAAESAKNMEKPSVYYPAFLRKAQGGGGTSCDPGEKVVWGKEGDFSNAFIGMFRSARNLRFTWGDKISFLITFD